nr:thioredoxin family protein [Methanosarcina sp. UBA5]
MYLYEKTEKCPNDKTKYEVKKMKIEILGTGCSKCKKTKEKIEKVLKQNGLEAEVIKIEDIEQIMNYGVMVTPAVVIDGEVKVAGKVPDEKDIQKWITQ